VFASCAAGGPARAPAEAPPTTAPADTARVIAQTKKEIRDRDDAIENNTTFRHMRPDHPDQQALIAKREKKRAELERARREASTRAGAAGRYTHMRSVSGPQAVDQAIREAIATCWMMLPDDKRSVDAVEAEIRRLTDRALKEFREDASVFGLADRHGG
jgi:hypothetical protein